MPTLAHLAMCEERVLDSGDTATKHHRWRSIGERRTRHDNHTWLMGGCAYPI